MSYQERRVIVSLISNIIIVVLYCSYMVERYPEGSEYSPEVFHFWGTFFLTLIPVSIVAKIIIAIIFAIINAIATQEAKEPIVDERDKLIESKAQTNAGYIFIIGFIAAMSVLVIEMPPSVMFIILLCAGIASEVVSELFQLFYYRRGF